MVHLNLNYNYPTTDWSNGPVVSSSFQPVQLHVTRHEKTGLMYTKCTYSYYSMYQD